MNDNLPPRQYAEQVLGRAASREQLDELFELHAAAHPVVEHSWIPNEAAKPYDVTQLKPDEPELVRCTTVVIYDHNPSTFEGPPAATIASGQAVCNPLDQWNRRLGTTIAFGRALKELHRRVEGERQDKAVVH